MNRQIAIAFIAPILAFTGTAGACTAFYAVQGEAILAGNNEDAGYPLDASRYKM